MTPAINLLKRQKIRHNIHQYQHDPAVASYGLEAAEVLNLPPERVFKTLLVSIQHPRFKLAVAILPVNRQLDLKLMAKAMAVKKAEMADVELAERTTGYLVGGISPLGQKKHLPTVIDNSANAYETMFVSGGRRGLDIELSPKDLAGLTQAEFSNIAR